MIVEVIGWVGAGSLLLAYGLLSAKRIGAGVVYQLLNLAGAVGLAVNAVAHGAWPSACLNLIWLVIGLVALRRERHQLRRVGDQEDAADQPVGDRDGQHVGAGHVPDDQPGVAVDLDR